MLSDPLFWAGSRVGVPTAAPTASLSVSPPAPCQSWTPLCSLLSMEVGVATMTQDLGPSAGLASDRTAALPPALRGSGPAGSCVQPAGFSLLGSAHRSLRALLHPSSPCSHGQQCPCRQGCVPRGHRASGQSPVVPSAEGCLQLCQSLAVVWLQVPHLHLPEEMCIEIIQAK